MSSWSVHQGCGDNFTIFSDLAEIGTVSVAPGDQSSSTQPQWRVHIFHCVTMVTCSFFYILGMTCALLYPNDTALSAKVAVTIALLGPCAGQNLTGNQISSSTRLGVSLSPIRSGTLFLDSNLTVNGTTYAARALLDVSAGPAVPSRSVVTGPGIVGAVALQPATFYVQVQDSYGNPAVSLQTSGAPAAQDTMPCGSRPRKVQKLWTYAARNLTEPSMPTIACSNFLCSNILPIESSRRCMDKQESVRHRTLQAADCTAVSFQSSMQFFSSPTAVPAFDDSTCAVSYTAAAGEAPFAVFYSGQNAASSPDGRLDVVATAEAFDANNTFVIPRHPRYVVAGTQVAAFPASLSRHHTIHVWPSPAKLQQ